ncbi:dnaJ homolog subfamily C member 11 [Hetaerina americana]|uniref:dnaJ homolog subfamily C member 11 n=1 Tax=Hetaerina americana TaxID=62018 RepID=UPI003A7F0FE9
MEDEGIEPMLIEENYYAFLNVPRNATNEEITIAYRRLSRVYHPDKHLDLSQKKEAEILFNKTKRAYEVLSDPHQRAIYDSVGVKGLQTEGWEIVQRTKTPQEIREEFERLAREQEERRLQMRTNPKGSLSVNINATDIFSSYEDEYDYDEVGGDRIGDAGFSFPIVEVSGMTLSQSIEAPLTVRDTLCLSGQLSTHNGVGGGSVTTSVRRLLPNRGWVEAEVSAGNGPLVGLRTSRVLTKHTFLNVNGSLQMGRRGIRPAFMTSLGTQLDQQTMGYMTWRMGQQSSLTTTVVRQTKESHLTFSIQFGIPHSFASISYSHKISVPQEIKVRGAIRAGTFGAVLEYGVEKKVSKHSSLSAAVSFGVPNGVTLKIKLTRASQTYSFPIHLSEDVAASPVFYATIAPVVVWLVVKRLVVDPYVMEQQAQEKEKQRQVNRARILEKQREARAAVELMRATFSRIRSEEESRKGLVIVRALYGVLLSTAPWGRSRSARRGARPSSGSSAISEEQEAGEADEELEVIDVTVPLQCLVRESKLILYESTKSQLPGFYDPCVGEEKSLSVQYLFHGHLHECVVQDNDPLRIPKQSHRVNMT